MTSPNTKTPLIKTRGLKVYFPVQHGQLLRRKTSLLKAVDGIDLDIFEGETLGLVGESGCGKTTTGRAILQLIQPSEGKVWHREQEISALSEQNLRPLRRKIQIIFQDPYSSLNPRMTVGDIIAEPIIVHDLAKRGAELTERVTDLFEVVGLNPNYASRFPHEFSGGQRQRIGIARALSLNPEFIVADEPVSALDVSVQAQVLNLLMDLQERFSLTYLFIAHNLAVVRHISDRVAVMYLGKIVEICPSELLYATPMHPYTKVLLSAVLPPSPAEARQISPIPLKGEMPSPLQPPSGCTFHPRCPFASQRCIDESPKLRIIAPEHTVACHHAEELEAGDV